LIVSRLNGGLGNQMFQYAIGKNLARKRKTDHGVDIVSYSLGEGITPREYSLGDFFADPKIVHQNRTPPGRIRNQLQRFYPYYKRKEVIEQSFLFDPNILKAPKECTLIGYWQSEKYFKEAETIIREDFKFRPSVTDGLDEIAKVINDSHSVSIHFRRGDYVKNAEVNSVHGLCDMDYYKAALKTLNKKYSDLKLFVFSDDINWVANNFSTDQEMTFITQKDKAIRDMYLMSLCKHHIIANSSFSWWGAWLGTFPDKTVIAPQRWFKTAERKTDDLLPLSWIRV
jgi:hypothetical protein